MKIALAGSGLKTHFVSDTQTKRTYPKTLCGQRPYAIFEDNGNLATGTDGYCKRCQASKKRLTNQ